MNNDSPPVGAVDHPLVRAYLAELTSALDGAAPAERDEVIQMVREHIDLALGSSPAAGDDEVRTVLRSLGSPHDVAAGADPARSGGPVLPSPVPRWLGIAALTTGAVSLLLVVLVPLLSAPLAVVALVGGLIGMRADRGPGRWRFKLAAALGGLSAVILVVLSLTLLGAGQEVVPDEPVPATEPAG